MLNNIPSNLIKKTQTIKGKWNIVTTYAYDDENRLIEIVSGTTVITYAYDPFGRRIEKDVNGTITSYVYDNEDIILAYNAAGNIKAKYTQGLNIDEPLAVKKGDDIYYYHADGLGSIVALTDAAGAVVETYSYDSFGNMTKTGDIRQPFTYTAREFDSETGLYYYRARYYDAKAGRFLQRDPIGFEGSDVNLYAYVLNNPVNWIDPSGMLCVYTQTTGSLVCTNAGLPYLICKGYSGKGAGLDNPNYQDIKNVGPIPRNDYSIGAPNRKKGPITLPLNPINSGDKPTSPVIIPRTGGYLIHGDNPAGNNTASEGCVILPPNCRKKIPFGEILRVVQ